MFFSWWELGGEGQGRLGNSLHVVLINPVKWVNRFCFIIIICFCFCQKLWNNYNVVSLCHFIVQMFLSYIIIIIIIMVFIESKDKNTYLMLQAMKN